jgi:hypothetical protein
VIAAKVVKQQKGVKLLSVAKAEAAVQLDAGTLHRRLRFLLSMYCSDAHSVTRLIVRIMRVRQPC